MNPRDHEPTTARRCGFGTKVTVHAPGSSDGGGLPWDRALMASVR